MRHIASTQIGGDVHRYWVSDLTPDFDDELFDRWPPDLNDDQTVNILDVLALKPHFNATYDDPIFSRRHDLNADMWINILDVLVLKPVFNMTCSP